MFASHLTQEHMSIESLEVWNFISSTTDACQNVLVPRTNKYGKQHLVKRINLNSDDLLIALHLLRRVAAKAEKPYVHGRHLKPIVLRGDSRNVGDQHQSQSDRHCTFVNFPYFSLQTPSSPPQEKHSHLHTAPGLLQTMYLLESTKLRDEEQAICKLRADRYAKASIHVPQIWSILIGSGKCSRQMKTRK